jgi:Flp pilus assembly pilin Flp
MSFSGGSHKAPCPSQPVSWAQHAFSLCCAFVTEDEAATMAEYALLVALIATVVALTLLNIGTAVRTKFSSVSSCLTANSTC